MIGAPAEKIAALAEKIAGRRVVASVSGGKDSAAMSLRLKELGIEHDRVFLNTGWESDITYEYLRGELTDKIGPIMEISAPRKMVKLVLRKGMFPSRVRRFCTQELKVFPMQKYLQSIDDDVINAVGIRRGESRARSRMEEWEWSDSFDCEVWRPIIEWSEKDVIDIHTRHGLRPNPLYLQGASRVGCWPCIFARKKEIRHIADSDPARIDLIRRLEQRVAERARRRYAAKGETFESLGYSEPVWFQAPLRTVQKKPCTECAQGALELDEDGRCASCHGTKAVRVTSGEPWPIDKIVSWSRTSRGGRQLELFQAPPSEQGCMRWGLCETDDD